MRSRRHLLCALPVALVPTAFVWGQTPPLITTGGLPIGLEPVVTGLSGQPVAIDYAPDSSGRLFIATRTNGQVRLHQNDALAGTPFLDFVTAGLSLSGGGEKGLLGMAFHPNFSAAPGTPGRGKFYTYSSEPRAATVDFSHPELGGVNGSGGDHDSVYREWTVDPLNPNTVNYAAGSRIVLRLRQPQGNHNGGAIRFDPNGYLYLSLGDGGGANDHDSGSDFNDPDDGHTSPGGNAQDLSNVYGKILRIDPLAPADNPGSSDPVSGNGKYRVPAGNPFVSGSTNVDEIYAFGLRNPFQIAFDRMTGTLYAGDVGQGQREEVDIITGGGNYGWVNMEGTRTNTTAITDINPIGEYTHSDGVAVIGGTVYRGENIPELYGKYIFGELDGPSTQQGRVFYMDAAGGVITEFTYTANATFSMSAPTSTLHSIGEGSDGELYATFANGTVARILGRQWLNTGGGSWNSSGNWVGGVPNAPGSSANFLRRATGNATITLDGNKSVGRMLFNDDNSYTITPGSGGALSINGGGAHARIDVRRGDHHINVPTSFGTSTDFNIADGATITFGGPMNAPLSQTLVMNGLGTVISSGGVTFAPASILTLLGGNFTIAPGSPTGTMGVLSITAGRLDLSDNAVVLTNTPAGTFSAGFYDGASGFVAAGRNGGAWNGEIGVITSDTRAINTDDFTTIGVARASEALGIEEFETAVWNGRTINGDDTLMMFTYGGDATLDGKLNIDDYGKIDGNVGQSGSVFGWSRGDFNYDGKINIDDYGVIDGNINRQGPSLSSSMALTQRAAGTAAVPEPVCGTIFVLGGVAALTRRHRRARGLR